MSKNEFSYAPNSMAQHRQQYNTDVSYEIVSLLSQGMHPYTQQPLPQNHVCNDPRTIRALMDILRRVDTTTRNVPYNNFANTHNSSGSNYNNQNTHQNNPNSNNNGKPFRKGPENARIKWTVEMESQLKQDFEAYEPGKVDFYELSKKHSRTVKAIKYKLSKLGLIEFHEEYHNKKENNNETHVESEEEVTNSSEVPSKAKDALASYQSSGNSYFNKKKAPRQFKPKIESGSW